MCGLGGRGSCVWTGWEGILGERGSCVWTGWEGILWVVIRSGAQLSSSVSCCLLLPVASILSRHATNEYVEVSLEGQLTLDDQWSNI